MPEGAATPATPAPPSPAPTDPTTPTTQPGAPTAPTLSADDEAVKDPAALLRTYRKLQEEHKASRTELTRFQEAQRLADEAKLSETERLQKRLAALETRDAAREKALQQRTLGYEIALQAGRLNIVDPDAAVKLLDLSLVEYDADGRPQNLDRALKALVKDKPYLVAAAPGAQGAQQPPAMNPTNPATRSTTATSTRRYSAADLSDRDFYNANREDIIRAMREGRIDP